jgi:hypothetical protein
MKLLRRSVSRGEEFLRLFFGNLAAEYRFAQLEFARLTISLRTFANIAMFSSKIFPP